ncbi:hypothetical protein GOB86_07755 [Acetobacter lambici]|uniref:Uncharacterized protein n=1 Tax=Acetobacter lambici TaxID=1332824 RepID=A0ABT1F0C6_9PROT|nr:hypothetical protein [Acetobacter lambici]MCP1242477.1 hypothetical protein [Acetobacter lambici]MCP1258657.1 hypothetical protein [Acetobacter lambici]NHO56958.1 hypothetical protein [Acetobacter lambici]
MVRLSIGDHVSDIKGTHDGKLVDIDGTTGYVLQSNGVEIEFPLQQLKPYEAPKVAEVRTLSGPLRDKLLNSSQKALLASIPASLMAAIAKSYDAGSIEAGSRPPFAALPDSKRLEIIRIYLPTLPQRLLASHMNLVVAIRDSGKSSP